ncbi:MAG: AEC family transporter [Clostridia bacterium]|nr:AEC family transporter [Clostridia bacterium]
MIKITFESVAAMFLMVVVGFAARKFKLLSEENSKAISRIIITIGQPFLMISALINAEYSLDNLKYGGKIILVGLGVFLVSGIISHLNASLIKDKDKRSIAEYAGMFANSGFMGIPLLTDMYGRLGAFWCAFFVIVFNVVCWTWGMFILHKANPEIKISVKNMFINYGTVPALIGFLMYIANIAYPAPLKNAITTIGSLCTPLSMLIVGGLLATIPFRKLLSDIHVYLLCAVRLIIIPLAIAAICRLIGLQRDLSVFAIVISALPSASNTSVFAERYGIAPQFAAKCVGMATVLSAVTVPGILWLADRYLLIT